MEEINLVLHQRVYENKAIFRYIKHTEHLRTEEYICTTEEGDIYIEKNIIADDVLIETKNIPLIKAAPIING